jgi:hypothetical protein
MAEIDWDAPVGSTSKLLACIPGLKENTLHKWMQRDKLCRRGDGNGVRTWFGRDVAEVATVYELGRLGILHDKVFTVWMYVQGRLARRTHPGSAPESPVSVLLALDAGGHLVARPVAEDGSDDGGGMDRPDAPNIFVVFRVDQMLDRLAARIASVAPAAVRRGAKG